MKIRPLGDRILVKRVKEEEKSKGGIIIPDTAKEKPQEGKVVAVGKGKMTEAGKLVTPEVKAGDTIFFLLRQDALAAVLGVAEVAAAVLDHGGPLQGHRLREFVGGSRFCCLRGILTVKRGFPLRGYGILVDGIVACHVVQIRRVTG